MLLERAGFLTLGCCHCPRGRCGGSFCCRTLVWEHLLGFCVLQNAAWKYFKNKDVDGSSPFLGVQVPWVNLWDWEL